MKSLKSLLIWILVSGFSIGLGIGLTFLIFKETKNFPFFGCGIALLIAIIDLIISKKSNYHLDILVYNSDDEKFMLLNDILIGCLCSIPLTMFVSILL